MRRAILLLCAIIGVITSPALAIDSAKIDSAINRAKEWLYKQQQTADRWEQAFNTHGDQSTGLTALAVYSLLSAGEDHQDPRIAAAVEYLKKTDTNGTYALGMRCQVWLRLPQTPEVKRAMAKDATILRTSMITTGKGTGFYPYNPGATAWSLSRAQYAVLGLWAAAQSGIEIPTSIWQTIETAWTENQESDGGWGYNGKGGQYPVTPGITAVGVATLFITQDYLHSSEASLSRGNLESPSLNRGMKWMISNFDKVATNTTFARDYPYATLYAVERIGVASGFRYFGTIDWYDKGAQWLLEKQKADGSWSAEDHGAIANTCFAVLFLSRGRAPLAMNKLDYSATGGRAVAWNQRPRDAANVSRWIGRNIEKDINWQIVNLSAPPADWHDAPILYISGGDDFAISDAARQKIRQFIEQGGLVLGNADTGSRPFTAGFRRLGQELFPSYEFRELPAEHVIYNGEQFQRAKWRTKPSVLGLSNGVRELMLLIPQADIGRLWQTQGFAREEYWQLASNIFLYSVDSKLLRKRGESYLVDRDPSVIADRQLKIARLKYIGNWDPEPGGWRRLANILHNQEKLDVDVVTVDLAKDSLDSFKIAHLTGTDKFKLTDPAKQKLRAFISAGGTLVVDAAGGASNFATAAEQELAFIPDFQLTSLPRDHALFKTGSPIATIGYRPRAASIVGALKDESRIRAMEINGRLAIIFSREDLSAGLMGSSVDGIIGYDSPTSVEIMKRILLYALK